MKRLVISTVIAIFSANALFLPKAKSHTKSSALELEKVSGLASSISVPKSKILQNRLKVPALQPMAPENIVVKMHRRRSVDGVTGLQPGGGLIKPETAAKSVSTVSRDFIQKQSPAQNPLQLVELLPGVVVGSADPFGLTGGTISIRGLDQSEMAMTWEGAPATDIGI